MYEKIAEPNGTVNIEGRKLIKLKKELDKGRVRNIQNKVWDIIKRPLSEQEEILGPDWL